MKLTKLFTVILLVSTVMFGCKSKSSKELIVNKWKLTAVSDEMADSTSRMSEESKKEMIGKVSIELTKDGKCIMQGVGDSPGTGTYSLSDDGKTLKLTEDGATRSDVMGVNELTDSKLMMTDEKGKVKMTFSKQ